MYNEKINYVVDLIKDDIKKRDSHLLNDFSLEFVSVKNIKKVAFLLEIQVNVIASGQPVVMIYTYDLLNDTHLRLEDIK
jgi:hypothetical protein